MHLAGHGNRGLQVIVQLAPVVTVVVHESPVDKARIGHAADRCRFGMTYERCQVEAGDPAVGPDTPNGVRGVPCGFRWIAASSERFRATVRPDQDAV